MGPYLSAPITEKHTKTGTGNGFNFCVAEMQGKTCTNQGWRKTMQDAAIHETTLKDGNALFGVFDGHGGNRV